MKAQVTWILIANGAQARVFEHDGPGKGLVPVKGLTVEDDHHHDPEVVADKPGRGATAIERRIDPAEQRETDFVKGIAQMLEEKRAAGAYDRLIIAAAPVALGELRPELSDGVKKATIAELSKDLTNIPTAKLASHFDGLIAV